MTWAQNDLWTRKKHQKLVGRMMSSAVGGAGFLRRIRETCSVERDGFAGAGRIGGRFNASEEMRRKEERVGEALAMRLRGTRRGGMSGKEALKKGCRS